MLASMPHPLDGAVAKIRRAQEHIRELEKEITSGVFNFDAVYFGQKFDSQTSTIEVTLEGVPQLPVRWGLLAADLVQNLRAALDYVAWELAVWNLARQGVAREPERNTQFPINSGGRNTNTGEDPFSDHMVRDLAPEHVALIRELQPNSGSNLVRFSERDLEVLSVEALTARHPLTNLADLSNHDKHQVVLSAGAIPEGGHITGPIPTDCEIVSHNTFMQAILYDGAKWAEFEVSVTGPEPKVEMKDRIQDLSVAYGSPKKWVFHAELPGMIEAAVTVVSLFTPVFAQRVVRSRS